MREINHTRKESIFVRNFKQEYGINSSNNLIKLRTYIPDNKTWVEGVSDIFSDDGKGNLKILVYTLDRHSIQYTKKGVDPEKNSIAAKRDETYYVTRYAEPQKYTDPATGEDKFKKYNFPGGVGTHPFFPPALVQKYENKTKINTLILTEGYKKAWLGSQHGLDVVGLSSITHFKQKNTNAMYDGVIKLIVNNEVENVVILWDADHEDISPIALKEGEDLFTRPNSFYNSAKKIRELLKDYNVDVYYAHIKNVAVEGHPKGLDDMLLALSGKELEFVDELLCFSDDQANKKYSYKLNITTDLPKLTEYLSYHTVNKFFQRNRDIVLNKELNPSGTFKYRGTIYSEQEDPDNPGDFILKVEVPKCATDYLRVGDDYFEKVNVPNKYEQLEQVLHRRKKTTISDDHGREIFQHIPKYKAFCNTPNHLSFNQTPHSCYNLYTAFDHIPHDDGDGCEETIKFLKHIFDDQFELGLDYVQLLYQRPTQLLPILCLVSKESNTGKTTYIKWLKEVFTNNCTIIGNEDFSNDFNSHWVSKLLIACEESFIDKKPILEKIKALSTADKTLISRKGIDKTEIDFFGKFLFASNNETSFIQASTHDDRYWVRKITKPPEKKVNLLENYLIPEIPAFLHYLNQRDLSTTNENRMWFNVELLVTDALRRLQDKSKPGLQKEIESHLKKLFIETGSTEILLPIAYIKETLLNNNARYSEDYIKEVLEERMEVEQYRSPVSGKISTKTIDIPFIDPEGEVHYKKLKKQRPYIFTKDQILAPEDIENYEIKENEVEENTDNSEKWSDDQVIHDEEQVGLPF